MKERSKANSEPGKREPTLAQQTAAEISFLLNLAERVKTIAKDNFKTRKQRRKARAALTDLFFIKENDLPIEPFNKKWGTDAEQYSSLIDNVYTELSDERQKSAQSASNLSALDRVKIAGKATRKLTSLPETRKRLFETAGYMDLGKKLSTAAGLTLLTGNAANLISTSAVAYETVNPLVDLGPITDGKALTAVALSYLLHYASIGVASRTNRRLLEDPNINTCSNLWATSLYFLLEKLVPDSKASNMGIHAGTYGPALVYEPAVLASLAIPVIGPQIVFARNMAGIAINSGEALGNTLWRKVKRRKTNEVKEN